jgi:hypothetical protein
VARISTAGPSLLAISSLVNGGANGLSVFKACSFAKSASCACRQKCWQVSGWSRRTQAKAWQEFAARQA